MGPEVYWKSYFSAILSLLLLLSLVPFTARAVDPKEVDAVTVLMTKPVAGEKPEFAYEVIVQDSRCKATDCQYIPMQSNGTNGKPMNQNSTFVDGTTYKLSVQLKGINGYSITENTKVTIAGYTATRLDNGWYNVQIRCGSSFDDVKAKDWFFPAVEYCFAQGLMQGTGNNKFSPNRAFTRGMFVTVLARIAGANLEQYTGKTDFVDVGSNKWYAKAVHWALDKGYTNGVSDTKFAPDKGLTRETIAVFFYRYMEKVYGKQSLVSGADLSSFTDRSKISSWATDAMAWAVQAKLINGITANGKTSLQPKQVANRAVVAQIIMNFMENVVP